MSASAKQNVNSRAGREKENVLAEFAYQPAAEGHRHGGELGKASKGQVGSCRTRLYCNQIATEAAPSLLPGG